MGRFWIKGGQLDLPVGNGHVFGSKVVSWFGFSWFLVGFYGFSRWFHRFWLVSMVLKVVSWFSRWFHGFSWYLVGFPWFFKVVSLFFMVFGWFPWFFKVVSWFFMVFGWFPWFFKVVSWFLVGFHGFVG